MNVISGSPPATASDQPRNTKEIAPERSLSGTSKAIVLAACGVNTAAPTSMASRSARTIE